MGTSGKRCWRGVRRQRSQKEDGEWRMSEQKRRTKAAALFLLTAIQITAIQTRQYRAWHRSRVKNVGRRRLRKNGMIATHLHFARRYNGEWIPAGSGLVPMVLSGWTAHEDVMPCEGTLTRGDEIRAARECWDDDLNGLVSDN